MTVRRAEIRRERAKELDFVALDDERDPDAWVRQFHRYWPQYRAWYRKGDAPPARACRRMLHAHMPELEPVLDAWLERLAAPRDSEIARFLVQFTPPVFSCACTQAIIPHAADGPALVRNYDYDPDLCDGIVLRSRWGDTRVLATTDCMVGALDGVNEHGLAAALAFGGRRVVGDGFGIPIVVRYLLQTCRTVDEAVAALGRVPVHMAHTVALVDRTGGHATVFVSPDRGAEAHFGCASTNHQGAIEWPEHAERTASVERLAAAEALVATAPDAASAADGFAAAPLYRTDWAHAAGTVYTVVLRTEPGSAEYRWRDGAWAGDVTALELPPLARTVRYGA